MHGECLICDRIALVQRGENPWFVMELETGYVVIGDHQYFKGYTLFLCKQHARELHHLEKGFRERFLLEMGLVSEAVANAFRPDKLNIESLGNGDAHLHWHIFPRRAGDMPAAGPVWYLDKEIMFAESAKPAAGELQDMKNQLRSELGKLIG